MIMFVSGLNLVSFYAAGVDLNELVRPFLIQFAIQWVVGFGTVLIGAACLGIDSYRTSNSLNPVTHHTPLIEVVTR